MRDDAQTTRFVTLTPRRGKRGYAEEGSPVFGGVMRTGEQGEALQLLAEGQDQGPPEEETLQSIVRYILDVAEAEGYLPRDLREGFDEGDLAFHAGQIFLDEGRVGEVRLDFSSKDASTRYGTSRPPALGQDPGGRLTLNAADHERRHVSACFLWAGGSEESERALATAWDVRGLPAGSSLVISQASAGLALPREPIPIPVNPPLTGALRAIFAGGQRHNWSEDHYGRPEYRYETRDGVVGISFDAPPVTSEAAIAALVLAVQDLSVETADVFLILMSKIAELPDPARGLARIRLEEIAELRSVKLRRGSVQHLLQDFEAEVLRLADLRLRMSWKDYASGGTISFGRDRPDRFLDIVDWTYEQDGRSWTAFTYRCGQAMAHFLNPESLRWVGYYSQALLALSPYHEALTKKLGTFWIVTGMIAGKKGKRPVASMRSVLDFCGEEPDHRNPNRTVDRLIEAHHRLRELGLVEEIPELEPAARERGYFRRWLEEPRTLKLSDSLWQIAGAQTRASLPSPRRRKVRAKAQPQQALPLGLPASPKALQDTPSIIRDFRKNYQYRQEELAKLLSIRRETLSRYERGLRPLPAPIAQQILEIWCEHGES